MGRGDERPAWRPDTFTYGLLGTTLTLRYSAAKLLDYDAAILEASTNPFATLVLAHRAAQATRRDAERRATFKLTLARRLYHLGYDRDRIVGLYRFIDWLLRLPPDLEDRVWQDFQALEEVRAMPYITYPERRGIEQGRVDGLLSGIAAVLEVKFGDAGLALLPEIRPIADPALLQAILDRTKTAATPDDVRAAYAGAE